LADATQVGEIITTLRRHPMRTTKPKMALRDTFFEVDETIRTHPEIKLSAVSSGCAALVLVVHRFTLWVAHVGDCTCVLGTKKVRESEKRGGKQGANGAAAKKSALGGGAEDEEHYVVARKLTEEHTPTDLGERARCAFCFYRESRRRRTGAQVFAQGEKDERCASKSCRAK
jgi:hypothetical protein